MSWITQCVTNAHYNDFIMGSMASQITSLTIVYSAVYWGADQRKHQSSASLAFVRWIHRGLVNSPHKGPVTPKMFPFDDVISYMSEMTHPKWLNVWQNGVCPRRLKSRMSQMSKSMRKWCRSQTISGNHLADTNGLGPDNQWHSVKTGSSGYNQSLNQYQYQLLCPSH